MSVEPKILPQHLERQAYVYIRQSSMRQVEEHLESQDLQYQLVHRARALGWSQEQIEVIDDDLGKSAATATDREGFQILVAAVGLGQVGIILVTDVSRLARNCGDWYQLLDLATQLAEPNLSIGTRLDLVGQMCQMLNHDIAPDSNWTNENARRPRAPP